MLYPYRGRYALLDRPEIVPFRGRGRLHLEASGPKIYIHPDIAHLWNKKDIVELGPGKAYTDVSLCAAEAPEGSLILAYPGIYAPTENFSRRLLFKAMGNVGDVVIGDPQHLTGAGSGAVLFCEGIEFRGGTTAWRSNFYVSSNDAWVFFNRCLFSVQSSSSHAFQSPYAPSLLFRNCRMNKGYNTIASLKKDNTRHQKGYYPSYSEYQCSGSYLEADYKTSAMVGYGYEYGDYMIVI